MPHCFSKERDSSIFSYPSARLQKTFRFPALPFPQGTFHAFFVKKSGIQALPVPQSFENPQGSSEYSRSVRRRAVFAKNEAPKQGEPLCMNTFCNKAPRQKRACTMCGAFFRCPPRTVPVFLHSSLRTPVTRKTRFSFTKKETAKPAKERP